MPADEGDDSKDCQDHENFDKSKAFFHCVQLVRRVEILLLCMVVPSCQETTISTSIVFVLVRVKIASLLNLPDVPDIE